MKALVHALLVGWLALFWSLVGVVVLGPATLYLVGGLFAAWLLVSVIILVLALLPW